jgi:hypothetical protein
MQNKVRISITPTAHTRRIKVGISNPSTGLSATLVVPSAPEERVEEKDVGFIE